MEKSIWRLVNPTLSLRAVPPDAVGKSTQYPLACQLISLQSCPPANDVYVTPLNVTGEFSRPKFGLKVSTCALAEKPASVTGVTLPAAGAAVGVTHAENSEVFPVGPVAVAVTALEAVRLAKKEMVPEAFVVTLVEPTRT